MKKLARLWAIFAIALLALTTSCEEPTPAPLYATPEVLTFEADGASYPMTISAPADWEAHIVGEAADWLALEFYSGGATEGTSVQVTAWANRTGSTRYGEIVITSRDERVVVHVEQAAIEGDSSDLPVATRKNSYVINGNEYDWGSVAFTMTGENPSIVASPTSGLKGSEDFFSAQEYLFVGISPLLNGVEFNIKEEGLLFTLISTLTAAPLETVAPGMTDEVTKGRCCLTLEGNLCTLIASMRLANGTTLAINIEAPVESGTQVNDNTFSRGGEQKPIRASFCLNENGKTHLYLSPGGVDYAQELEIVTVYIYLIVDDALVDGNTHSLANTSGHNFTLGVVDNLDSTKSWEISSANLRGASGNFSIAHNGGQNYTATIEVNYEGVDYTALFEGDCVWYYDVPIVDTNYLILDGRRSNITSASINTSAEVWVVTLTTDGNDTIVATAPATFFDGNARGFSQSAELTVTCNGTTYSKANGFSGTFTALYSEDKSTLEVTFTNYAGCEISYSGAVTVVKNS